MWNKKHLYLDVHAEDAALLELVVKTCNYKITDICKSKLSEDRVVVEITNRLGTKLDGKRLGKKCDEILKYGTNLTVYPQ